MALILAPLRFFSSYSGTIYLIFLEILPPDGVVLTNLPALPDAPTSILALHSLYLSADHYIRERGDDHIVKVENIYGYYLAGAREKDALLPFAVFMKSETRKQLGPGWDVRGSVVKADDFRGKVFSRVYQPIFFHYALCLASRLCHACPRSALLYEMNSTPNSTPRTIFAKNIGDVQCYEVSLPPPQL